jgi:ABC-type antimicrobial peptide transport system permease subunit
VIVRNLLRRKGRTILTVLGIAIGVAAIVALGAVARGLQAGFEAMSAGSDADLVLTQGDAISALLSSVDEAVAAEIGAWPGVAAIDGVLLSNAMTGEASYVYLFGYDPEGFSIAHFRIVEGESLAGAQSVRGKPLLLGRRAAQSLSKEVGDTFHITGSAFRIVGIYETGNGFEDGGAVIPLQDAQALALQPGQVSMLYLQLDDPRASDRLQARIARSYPELAISTASAFADQEQILAILDGVAMAIAGLAVVIGGIGMANTLFMSVFERTREIGVLRALGWRRRRVMGMILGESMLLSLAGGLLGVGLGIVVVLGIAQSTSVWGSFGSQFTPSILIRALVTVCVLGAIGGAYPAWWASRLLPVEALRYEGGGATGAARIPGGMAVRNLWRRRTRTLLTVVGIGISVAAIVAMGAVASGGTEMFTAMWRASQADLIAIEAGVDNDLSAIDERVGARIEARPDVEAVSGVVLTAVNTDQMPMLIVFGYHPRSFALGHFSIIVGERLSARHQVIVGKQAAEQMGVAVGDTLRLLRSNFRIVGIFETGQAYEEIGVVISLREVQSLTGKPHQVMYYAIKLRDPRQAEAVRDDLRAAFPELDLSLTADVAESMSDFQVITDLVGQISVLAVTVGGLGMLNTMLMSVLERTREIGVLRALGWRQRQVIGLILRESLLLGLVGGSFGLLLGFGLTKLMALVPGIYGAITPVYGPQLIAQAGVVAIFAGGVGGLYPAWRAMRMRPVEALRYE